MLSIIIPCYNVASYLDRCLQGVVKLDNEDLEIICINDGSTDDTLELLNAWKVKDSRLQVYTKVNGGLSDARNFGLAKSCGDAVFFLDSDDELVTTRFEKAYQLFCLEGFDMLQFGRIIIDENSQVIGSQSKSVDFVKKSSLIKYYADGRITSTVWDKIYKKEILVEFLKGKLHEDHYFMPKVLTNAKNCAIIDDGIVRYRQRKGSIMDVWKDERFHILEAQLVFRRDFYSVLDKTSLNKRVLKYLIICYHWYLDSTDSTDLYIDKLTRLISKSEILNLLRYAGYRDKLLGLIIILGWDKYIKIFKSYVRK